MSNVVHEMSEEKRKRIIEQLYVAEQAEENILEIRKRQQLERARKKRAIVVEDLRDLNEKYEDYLIDVNIIKKLVTIKRPLEVKYLSQFKADCNKLGYRFIIDAD